MKVDGYNDNCNSLVDEREGLMSSIVSMHAAAITKDLKTKKM